MSLAGSRLIPGIISSIRHRTLRLKHRLSRPQNARHRRRVPSAPLRSSAVRNRTPRSVLWSGLRVFMDKIIDFRQHAQECRQLAARCKVPEESEMLLRMADSWDAGVD